MIASTKSSRSCMVALRFDFDFSLEQFDQALTIAPARRNQLFGVDFVRPENDDRLEPGHAAKLGGLLDDRHESLERMLVHALLGVPARIRTGRRHPQAA